MTLISAYHQRYIPTHVRLVSLFFLTCSIWVPHLFQPVHRNYYLPIFIANRKHRLRDTEILSLAKCAGRIFAPFRFLTQSLSHLIHIHTIFRVNCINFSQPNLFYPIISLNIVLEWFATLTKSSPVTTPSTSTSASTACMFNPLFSPMLLHVMFI